MKLRFTKMHGAGNDFVVVDATRAPVSLTRDQWRWVANRQFGIGADQILIVQPADTPEVDFVYRIFNADGGEVEHCGNGARCFMRYVHDHGLTDRRQVRVRTKSGDIELRLIDEGRVQVNMGPPILEPGRVPFDSTGLVARMQGSAQLWPLDGTDPTAQVAWVHPVSMGNPHAVQLVDDVRAAPVRTQGPWIESHPRFPNRVNAGYLQVLSRSDAIVRVFERGVGETYACGTGVCAAVVSGIQRGLLDETVNVQTHGGRLTIQWTMRQGTMRQGHGGDVLMTGPTATVFESEVDVPEPDQVPEALRA